jgi:tetratricopeptide (TPR) repeat protein
MLNVRLALILLTGGTFLGGGVHWLHHIQVHRHATTLLAAAEDARDEQNLAGAIGYLNSYLGLSPGDMAARQQLGFLLAETKKYAQAYTVLEQVLRSQQSADSSAVRRKLVEVAVAIGRWQDVETHVQAALREDEDNPSLLSYQGQCQVAMGRLKEARTSFETIIKKSPNTVDAYPRLALVLRRLEQPGEDDRCMKKMAENNPSSLPAQVLYGQYLLGLHRLDEAGEQARKVVQLAPNDFQGLMLAGWCAVERQQFDEAAGYAERAIHVSERVPFGYFLLAQTKARTGHRDEAMAALRRGLQKTGGTPGYLDLLWHVANLHVESGQPMEAQKLAAELKRLGHNPTAVRCLEARIEMSQGHWKAALAGFEALRPDLTDRRQDPHTLKQVDYWIGQCYSQSGNIEQQLAAYRRAVVVDPTYFPARDGIAEIFVNAGRFGEAIDEYLQAIRAGSPDEQIMLALARTMVLQNLRLPPEQRDWNRVERVLDDARKTAPASQQIPLLRTEIMIAKGDLKGAERLLSDRRKAAPDHVEFWIALAVLDERQEKWEMAKKHLQDVEDKFGDSVQLRIARAHYLLRRYGNSAARELRKLAEDNLQKFSSDDRVQLWTSLIAYSIQANDYVTGKHLCQEVARKDPNNVRIRYLLFELIIRSREYRELDTMMADVDRVLDEMEASGGRGPLWLYGQAVRLTIKARDNDRAFLAQALSYIKQARDMRPSWPPLPLLAARVYELQGTENQMIDMYKEAIRLGEHDPTIIRRAVELLQKKQRWAEATMLLRGLEESQTQLPQDLIQQKVVGVIVSGALDEAVRSAGNNAIDPDSENYRDHLWLGQILGALVGRAKTENRPDLAVELQGRAEKSLRRALALNEHSVDTWIALVQLLAATGQKGKAEEAIAQAREKTPPGTSPLALARCYEAVGDMEKAARGYQEALTAAPNKSAAIRELADFYLRSGKTASAEPLLGRLVKGAREASEADKETAEANAVWARRMIAAILMNRGGFQNLTEALRLIDQNVASGSGSVDDRLIKAQLLLDDPRRDRIQEAIRTLEELIQSGGLVKTHDRFVLAQLYLRQGEWTKYNTMMREVFASREPDPGYFVFHVNALLRHGNTGDADVFLTRLEQLAPNDFNTLSLRAEFFSMRKEYTKAVNLLAAYLDRPGLEPADRTTRRLLTARIAERCARKLVESRQDDMAKLFTEKAETLLRAYIKERPDQESVLAVFLAHHGRAREALELISQSWKNAKPEGLAAVAAAITYQGTATEAEFAQLDRLLQDASKQFNGSLVLLLALADSALMQQNYPAADARYRAILATDPENVKALNNLSLLLAYQGKGSHLDEALEKIGRAIRIAGPSSDLLDAEATVYLAMEQPEKALEDLQVAVANEATPQRLFLQARAYLLAGRKAEAVEAMKAAEAKNLSRTMLDPPQRPLYDKLRTELKE